MKLEDEIKARENVLDVKFRNKYKYPKGGWCCYFTRKDGSVYGVVIDAEE